MKTKIMKPLIRGGFILLCLSILGSLLSSSSVLAQEPIKESGELGEGRSDYIPFEIKVGEMVQGELACKEALRVIIMDPTLRESVDFGKIVGSFFYAAETDGRYRIKITNPTEETIGYTLTYTVLPTSLAPGTNSGPGMIRRNLPAIIFGVLAVGGIIYLFIRRKKKEREFEHTRDAFRKRIKMTE